MMYVPTGAVGCNANKSFSLLLVNDAMPVSFTLNFLELLVGFGVTVGVVVVGEDVVLVTTVEELLLVELLVVELTTVVVVGTVVVEVVVEGFTSGALPL